MMSSAPFFASLLVLALLAVPTLAQPGADNRNPRANGGASRPPNSNDKDRVLPITAADAAVFGPDLTRNNGVPIEGQFILQLAGPCEGVCLGQFQKALNQQPATKGCTSGNRAITIGPLRFVSIKCPKGRRIERDQVASAVSSLSASRSVPQISLVEQDFVVSIASVPTSIWGVDETDGGVTFQGPNYVRDGMRTCSATSNKGTDVDIWILDTGCAPTFGGKCMGYYGGNSCVDVNGHGGHVGATATDSVYGVAPNARRNCVKVLNDNGSGSYLIAISAIEYVLANKGSVANIINFSLSGPFYAPLNNAVEAAAAEDVYFTLAAGNAAQTVCQYSPGSATGDKVLTVQAHDVTMNAAWFTNYATAAADCTDISAPGVNILSYYNRPPGSFAASGTSMAAPHVAGAIAILISDGRNPTLSELTATGVFVPHGGGGLSKPSVGLSCT
ncbi:unnamed protein product [Agarophyton chilense]